MTEPRPIDEAGHSRLRPNRHWLEAAVAMATILLLAAFLLPAMLAARTTSRRTQSANNLRNLVISVHAFHMAQHRLPPGGVIREDGTGRLSWFVCIMPFVESSPLYDRIVRHDAPWDAPVRREWLTTDIALVRNPLVEDRATTDGWPLIHYAANPDLMYQNSRTSREDLQDPANCWIFGEVTDGLVPWAYPFNWREAGDIVGTRGSAFRNPLGTCQFAMVDGRIVEISPQGSDVLLDTSRKSAVAYRQRTERESPFARWVPPRFFATE